MSDYLIFLITLILTNASVASISSFISYRIGLTKNILSNGKSVYELINENKKLNIYKTQYSILIQKFISFENHYKSAKTEIMNILNPTSLKEEIQLEAIVIYNSDSFDYFLSEMKRLIPLGSRVRFNLKVFSSIGGNNQNFYPKPVNVGGKKEANTFVDMTYNSEDDLRQVLFELSYLLEYNKTVLIDMYSKKDDCIKSNLELKKLFHRYWENNEPWGKNILSWKILSSPSQIPEATKPLPELPMPKLVPIPVLDDNITELEMVVAKAEVDSTYRENLIKCLLSQKK